MIRIKFKKENYIHINELVPLIVTLAVLWLPLVSSCTVSICFCKAHVTVLVTLKQGRSAPRIDLSSWLAYKIKEWLLIIDILFFFLH